MKTPRQIYGWEADGKAYLSTFPAGVEGYRPRNEYASRDEAEAYAKTRNSKITWEN